MYSMVMNSSGRSGLFVGKDAARATVDKVVNVNTENVG